MDEPSRLLHTVKEAKHKLEEICEMVEEMDGESFGKRDSYGDGRSSSMGMRRGYRIYQDDDEDDGYGERRRRDSRGRYM